MTKRGEEKIILKVGKTIVRDSPGLEKERV